MSELTSNTVYFKEAGKMNTARTLELGSGSRPHMNLRQVLVASTNGDTGAWLPPCSRNLNGVVVSHSTGFRGANTQELTDANRRRHPGSRRKNPHLPARVQRRGTRCAQENEKHLPVGRLHRFYPAHVWTGHESDRMKWP